MHKIRYILLAVTTVLFCVSACDGDPYHGFGCIAPESHPAVTRVRSLTPKQLETVFIEVQKLNKIHSQENYQMQFYKAEIPESLSFLNAELIRVYRSKGPYIILANCLDERIELTLSEAEESEPTITLHWAEPTSKDPYAKGSEVIWRNNSQE